MMTETTKEPELGKLGAMTLAERFDDWLAEKFPGASVAPGTYGLLKDAYFSGAMEGTFDPRTVLREVIVFVEQQARNQQADALVLVPAEGRVQ